MLQEKLDGGLRAATAGRPAPALHESIPEFVAMDGAEQGGLEEGELEEGWEIHDFIRRAKVVEESQHPKQVLREALRGVAVLLRDRPTLPLAPDGVEWKREELQRGVYLPRQHCPFRNCAWCGEGWKELMRHVRRRHWVEEVKHAVKQFGEGAEDGVVYTVLNGAISEICRNQAPIVSVAQDRRSLRKLHEDLYAPELQGLICLLCGCVHPHLRKEMRPRIRWQQIGGRSLDDTKFLGLEKEDVEEFFGYEKVLERHGSAAGDRSWVVRVRLRGGDVRILCHAEDRFCEQEHHEEEATLCSQCWVPICHHCEKSIREKPPQMPSRALSNGLWTGFGSMVLLQEKATYLECILASPCMLSLTCFTLETQYGNVFMEQAQQQRFRVGARGNITLFPLPLQDIVQELMRQAGQEVCLPWLGAEVAHAVRVILRTSVATDARVICQATVRREVVVKLIGECVERKQPGYEKVSMQKVRERAAQLPEHGVLDEVVGVVEGDRRMTEMVAEKHATPLPGLQAVEAAFEGVRLRLRKK